MEPKNKLSCSQKLAIYPYPEPDESSSTFSHPVSVISVLILPFHPYHPKTASITDALLLYVPLFPRDGTIALANLVALWEAYFADIFLLSFR
jgi:hypothetical protein